MELARGTSLLLNVACVVVILAGLKHASPLVVPLLLAFFLAILSAPLVFELMRRGIHAYVAVGVAMLANLGFVGAIGGLGAGSLNAFAREMPRYQARVAVLLGEASSWLAERGVPGIGELLPRVIDYNALGGAVAKGIASLAGVVSTLVLVWLVVAFLLVELVGIEVKLRHVFDRPEAGIRRFRRAAGHVQRYILVKTATNLLTGILVWGWLAIWRVEFALLWALSAFTLNYIPTIGAAILGAPLLMLVLIQYGPGTCAVVGIGYIVINMLVATAVEPRILGRVLGLSPLVVFLSMVCWGWLWGPVGALLSVPLTMVVQIGAAYSEGYQWVTVLLGPANPEAARRVSTRPPVPSSGSGIEVPATARIPRDAS
jgi:AI-2 transport protein TqsA